MQTVNDVALKLNQIAPVRFAEAYDNVGVIVGDEGAYVTKALTCLDVTMDVVNEAKKIGANLIVSHHPAIFHPLKQLTKKNNSIVFECLKAGISVIACHTNFDIAEGGTNDVLLALLELSDRKMLEIIPGEMVGMGRIGKLENFLRPDEFAEHVKRCLGAKGIRFVSGTRKIKTVVVVGGSGGSYLEAALKVKADALVTGDVKHEVFMQAYHERITLVDAGHYATEAPGILMMTERLSRCFDDLAVKQADSAFEVVHYM